MLLLGQPKLDPADPKPVLIEVLTPFRTTQPDLGAGFWGLGQISQTWFAEWVFNLPLLLNRLEPIFCGLSLQNSTQRSQMTLYVAFILGTLKVLAPA